MSRPPSIQTLTGILALGPVQHGRGVEYFEWVRVGSGFLKHVRCVGFLASLLRNGQACSLSVATVPVPTPLLFCSDRSTIYAVEVDGHAYQALDAVRRDWAVFTRWNAFMLAVAGVVFLPILGFGLLLWLNAIRLLFFVRLPVKAMRLGLERVSGSDPAA